MRTRDQKIGRWIYLVSFVVLVLVIGSTLILGSHQLPNFEFERWSCTQLSVNDWSCVLSDGRTVLIVAGVLTVDTVAGLASYQCGQVMDTPLTVACLKAQPTLEN